MAKIEIYTTQTCPYCIKAKSFLDMRKIGYDVIDITGDNEARMALVEKSNGQRTVPQIFINGKPIGGYDDLMMLDANGELETLLGS